jgi:hypothetical protein
MSRSLRIAEHHCMQFLAATRYRKHRKVMALTPRFALALVRNRVTEQNEIPSQKHVGKVSGMRSKGISQRPRKRG